jgi:hypothetical protein
MTVKSRFICVALQKVGRDAVNVIFHAQPDAGLDFDESFYGPGMPANGKLEVVISNPEAVKRLVVGGSYYLYLTETGVPA